MSLIVIKTMTELPVECCTCPFVKITKDYVDDCIAGIDECCTVLDRHDIPYFNDKRPAWCPLMEIKVVPPEQIKKVGADNDNSRS